jgi:cytochrome c553
MSKRMRLASLIGLGGVFLAQMGLAEVPAEALTGDPAAGKKLAGQCRTCHGIDGFAKIPIAPHIGGENPAYIMHQLTAFREGTREHEMMTVVAKTLTDQQIADVAAWYSSHVATAALPAGKTDDMAPEDCTGCHGANGIAVVPDAPNLAGETAIYIDTQLKAFRLGKRKHEIMSVIAADLDDARMRELADWYAAMKLTIAPAP